MDGLLTPSDGRTLSYGGVGNPKAKPVLYCHGFATIRIEYEPVAQAVEKSGVDARVVVLGRLGYGSSTFQPRRRLLDWPKDSQRPLTR
jgi:pimeloyl-ACP methyl ester carboxylesterase